MTEFSGQAGRMSNNQFPQESDDERSLAYPGDDDTSADDLATAEDNAAVDAEPAGDGSGAGR
jgi:hypothetical protein